MTNPNNEHVEVDYNEVFEVSALRLVELLEKTPAIKVTYNTERDGETLPVTVLIDAVIAKYDRHIPSGPSALLYFMDYDIDFDQRDVLVTNSTHDLVSFLYNVLPRRAV